jgi:hypothetical protein
MIDTSLFPYENHPYRLEFGEKKEKTVCFFSCNEHLQKYLNRYKLDKRTLKIDYRDGEPTQSSKKHKNSVEQNPKSKSNRSSSPSKRRTTSLDTTTNSTCTTKSTKRKNQLNNIT